VRISCLLFWGASGVDLFALRSAAEENIFNSSHNHATPHATNRPPDLRSPSLRAAALPSPGAAPPSPSMAAAGGAAGSELLRRLKETQALMVKFSEENGRLARENDRLRSGRALLSTGGWVEGAGWVDECLAGSQQ
jgi:hypothetical protein